MYSFCPHCGQSIDQNQAVGQTLVCLYCRMTIGVVAAAKGAESPIQQELPMGAELCPACGQAVQLKAAGGTQAFVPHFVTGAGRKLCAMSGKAVRTESPASVSAKPQAATPRGGKDLSAYYKREAIRVATCSRAGDVRIEELTLAYLDKADRVRLQIEALRDILGKEFRMRPYPAALNRPHLGLWGNADLVVVAQKHAQGGYEPMSDAELTAVLAELGRNAAIFFA